jgi:hypothetical protein
VAPTARTYAITVTGQAGTDPDFIVHSGANVAAANAVGAVERRDLALPAGDVVIALSDYNLSITSPCFTVAIQ